MAVDIGAEIGCSASQVAIRWVQQQPGVIIPLLGARSLDQLRDNLGALEMRLEDEHLQRLDEASKIDLGFPHNFLQEGSIQELVYGGTLERLDHHRGVQAPSPEPAKAD